MLQRLVIRDFVLVDRLELEFSSGFGVLTGETGAGKSILVDALAFVLGERADTGLIRHGRKQAEVCAAFRLSALPAAQAWLQANDLLAGADDGELLLRRVLDAGSEGGGRSRAYVNGSPVTLAQIRELAEGLVDIHGQHAHQSLLRAEAQRQLLDAQAGLTPLAREVAEAWKGWRSARQALDEAASAGAQMAEERDRLTWQIEELTALGFSPEEWENLNAEHRRLAHAAGLLDGAQWALGLLAEGEGACEERLHGASHRLEGLLEFDPQIAEIASVLASAQAEVAEAVSSLRRYVDRADLDPSRLAEVEARLAAIVDCARKYRVPPESLPELLMVWQGRWQTLQAAADVAALAAEVERWRQRFEETALRLSRGRKKAASTLATAVSEVMQELALGGGRFEIALLPQEGGSAAGLESVEFRIAGTAGSPARSLAKVASGGELSRISLAIQVVTSRAAAVPTLVFDEVDVGIGGGVAEVVGRLLARLGETRQVLCVTHLPQVAARANWQWQVSKSLPQGGAAVKAGKESQGWRSEVSLLDAAGRVEEIARMLGGVEITATTREHAREMLAG